MARRNSDNNRNPDRETRSGSGRQGRGTGASRGYDGAGSRSRDSRGDDRSRRSSGSRRSSAGYEQRRREERMQRASQSRQRSQQRQRDDQRSRSRSAKRMGSGGGDVLFGDDSGRKSSRDAWILLFMLVFIAVLLIRLFTLQVVLADDYQAKSAAQRTEEEVVYAKRGTIYDRNGNILASSVSATTIYCNPREIPDAMATAQELAGVLGGEAEDYMAALTKDSAFSYILKKADNTTADALKARCDSIQEQIDQLPVPEGAEKQSNPLDGIYYLEDTKRVYPCGQTAGQVIGYVGIDGDGLSGLELQYNDILKGVDGHRVVEHGKQGIQIPGGSIVDIAPIDGTDIMISLDVNLQQYVEQSLQYYCEGALAVSGNVMILDGSTGEIYATASTPLYDLNNVSEAEEGADTLKSVSSIYEPGSTFKTVTASAVLEEGLATPEEVITVPAYLKYAQWIINDAHEHGEQEMTFSQIIEQSSNIGITLLEERLGDELFYSYLQKFGFGQRTGVDFPGEVRGILQEYQDWSDVQEANISFGQGVSVTTVQMASFYGMLAADGVYVQPHFLIGYPATGETVSYERTQLLSPKTCADLTKMLEGVVEEGTGTMAEVQGYTVAGKTGTSQKVNENGEYSQGAYIISFDGFLSNSSSNLACVVSIDNPASAIAMPIFADVMSTAANMYMVASYD